VHTVHDAPRRAEQAETVVVKGKPRRQSDVRRFPLHRMPCGVCGLPAQYAELHPNHGVRTVHIFLDRDLNPLITTCWSTAYQPVRELPLDLPENVQHALDEARLSRAAVRGKPLTDHQLAAIAARVHRITREQQVVKS
jgi:hypothetical protein